MGHPEKNPYAASEKHDQPPPYTYAPSGQSSNNNVYAPQPGTGYGAPLNRVVKTFDIVNTGWFSHKNLVLTLNGQAILWVNSKSTAMGFGAPEIRLCTDQAGMGVVAAARGKNWGSGIRIFLGNPDGAPKEAWAEVESESWTNKQFGFWFGGRKFIWKRTNDKSLGSSFFGTKDFKLLDCSDPQQRVLAVYIADKTLFSASQVGRVDFLVELGRDLELMALAAILGIEETLRRTDGAAAGSGAGGGA